MDSKKSRQKCWEITGCGHQGACKVLKLAMDSNKPCWEVVTTFDDYRSAMNVCGDCVVSVFYRGPVSDLNELKRSNSESSAHTCPGLTS